LQRWSCKPIAGVDARGYCATADVGGGRISGLDQGDARMRHCSLIAALLMFFAAGAAVAHDHKHEHHAPVDLPPPGEMTAARIADVPVLTQAGEAKQFYRDLVQGRLVAINFIFTRCTAVCPLLGARFSQLQKILGEDAAKISLISVSIDPANDTPQRLAQWSQGLGAQPGWTLVTGERADLDALLRSLGASAADTASHVPIALIVDERRQPARWQRLDGLADAAVLARALRDRLQPEEGG